MSARWSIGDALSRLTVQAARRCTDEGLRNRILGDEVRRIVAETDERIRRDRLDGFLNATWRDVFGRVHCGRCTRPLEKLSDPTELLCTCRVAA